MRVKGEWRGYDQGVTGERILLGWVADLGGRLIVERLGETCRLMPSSCAYRFTQKVSGEDVSNEGLGLGTDGRMIERGVARRREAEAYARILSHLTDKISLVASGGF